MKLCDDIDFDNHFQPKAPPAASDEPLPSAGVAGAAAAAMVTDKARRLSDADRAGYQARSPEGHAARGMSIRGQEDAWIRIQGCCTCT